MNRTEKCALAMTILFAATFAAFGVLVNLKIDNTIVPLFITGGMLSFSGIMFISSGNNKK